MPDFNESEEKAFKSGRKKDRKEPREKSMRQRSSKSTKSTSKLKSNKSKKETKSVDRNVIFSDAGGQLKARSPLKTNKSSLSNKNSLTSWSTSQAVILSDASKQSSALDSQSVAVLIKHKSTAAAAADHHHHHVPLKPKSSGIVGRHKSKSTKKVTRPKSAPKAVAHLTGNILAGHPKHPTGEANAAALGLTNAPGLLHIKAHGENKAKTAKSHRQLKPTPVNQKWKTNPSTYHQKSHVSEEKREFVHTKSPPHEVMIPAGRVYKVVKVHKVDKDGKQESDAPWEYLWKCNDSAEGQRNPDHPTAQTSTEEVRQAPPAINFVQVVKGPNLVLLNQPQKPQSPSDDPLLNKQQEQRPHSPTPQPKKEKKEGK